MSGVWCAYYIMGRCICINVFKSKNVKQDSLVGYVLAVVLEIICIVGIILLMVLKSVGWKSEWVENLGDSEIEYVRFAVKFSDLNMERKHTFHCKDDLSHAYKNRICEKNVHRYWWICDVS